MSNPRSSPVPKVFKGPLSKSQPARSSTSCREVEAEVIPFELLDDTIVAVVEMIIANTTVSEANFHEIAVALLHASPIGAENAASPVVEIGADLTDVDAAALDAHPVAGEAAVVEATVVVHLELAALVVRHLPPSTIAVVVLLVVDVGGKLVEPAELGPALEAVGCVGFISVHECIADTRRNLEPEPALAVFAGSGELVVSFAVVAVPSASDKSVEVDAVFTEFLQVLVLQTEGRFATEGFSFDCVALVVDQ